MDDIVIVLTNEEARMLKLLLLHEIRDNKDNDTINSSEYWDALRRIQEKLIVSPRPTLIVDKGEPGVFGGFRIEQK